jgi:integrase
VTGQARPKMRDGLVKRGETWSYVVRVDGRPTWVGGFRTRADAKRARDGARDGLHQQTYVPPARETLGTYLDAWVATQATLRRPGTVAMYTAKLAYVRGPLGRVRLDRLHVEQLDELYRDLFAHGGHDGQPLARSTVRLVHIVLRKALGDAVRKGTLAQNVAARATVPERRPSGEPAPVPGRGRPRPGVWSAAEVRRFVAAVEGDRLRALWVVLVNCGLRRGEALGLGWADVDLAAGRLAVRRCLVTVNGAAQWSPPKTPKSERSFRLDPVTVAALKAHRARQLAERLAVGAGWRPTDDLVFAEPGGSPLDPAAVSKRFLTLARRAGLPRIRLHDLRHSYATNALRAGVPVKVVSTRLGHASVAITLDIYAHVLPDEDDQAAETYHRFVFGDGPR